MAFVPHNDSTVSFKNSPERPNMTQTSKVPTFCTPPTVGILVFKCTMPHDFELVLLNLASTQVKVPVGAVWKLLPWNRGLPPTCSVEQVYLDDDVRIAKDTSGQYFVYARPV